MKRWLLLLAMVGLALVAAADDAAATHTNAGNQGQPYRLPWTWDLHSPHLFAPAHR